MKTIILSCLLLCIGSAGVAQLTSSDIRHASGKGPYPIYLNFQLAGAPTGHTFTDFTAAYAAENRMKDKQWLHGFEE